MDILASLTGSRVRADLLAALFGAVPRPWKIMELQRVTRRDHSPVHRELKRLAIAGLLHVRVVDGKRQFEPDIDGPVACEIARLVRQTRGRIPRIRHALIQLRSRTIAWIVPAPPKGQRPSGRGTGRLLIVLTTAPKSLARVQLANVAGELDVQCMSVDEWVARLQKGDVLLRHARRTRKLWVVGNWEQLVERERSVIDAKKLLKSAVANWQEELSDDWDDSWDPFQPFGVATR